MSSQPQLQGGYPINAYQVGGQYSGPMMSRTDSYYASQMQQGDPNNSQSLINERPYQSMPSPPHSQGSESPRESNITHSNKPDAPQAQQQQMQMRDANKQKPSELNTDVLRLSDRIEWLKQATRITTKIHYGKRQFVFELQDNNTSAQSSGAAANKDSQGEGEDGSDQLPKKKLELPFKDIKKLTFTKQKQEIIIETTFEKIKQCQESMKKPGGDIKKTTQWIEKNFLMNETTGVPLFKEKEPLNIISLYPKDSLTKSGSGRMSHLQKILLWVDVEHLFVDGERINRSSDGDNRLGRNAGQESQSFQNRDREREDSNSQAFNDQTHSTLNSSQTAQRQQQYHPHYNPHQPSSQQLPLHIQQQQQLRQQHPPYHPQLHQIGNNMGPQPPQHMQQYQGHPQGVSQQQYQSAQMQRQQNQSQYPPNAYQGQKPGGIPMKSGVGPGMGMPQQQLSQQQQSQQNRHLLNQNVVKEQFNLKDNNQDNLSQVYDTLKSHVSQQKTHPLNMANPPQPQSISAMGGHNIPGNYHHPRSSSSQQPNSQHPQMSRQQSSSVHPSQQPSPYGPTGMPMQNPQQQQYYNGSNTNNPSQQPYPPYASQGYPSQVKNIPYGIPSGSIMKHPQGNPGIMGQINPNGIPPNKQQQLQQQQQLAGNSNKYDHLQRQNSQQLQQQQLLSHSQQLPNIQSQLSSSQQTQHGSSNHLQQQQAYSNNPHLNNGNSVLQQKLKPSAQYPAEDDIPDVKDQILKLKSFIEDQKKLSSDVKREKLMERIRDLRNQGIEFTLPPPDKKDEDASAQKNNKKMKCVYFKCAKELKESQMNKHIKEAHPELVKVGFEMDSNKTFRFSEQLLDFALLIADIYPVQYSDFLKQIRPALKKKKKDKNENNKSSNNTNPTTTAATSTTSNGNSGTGEKDKEKSDIKKKSKKSKKAQKKEEKEQLKLMSQSQQQQLDSLQQSPSSS